MDKAKFANEVITRFKTVRPEWQPPHKTIFAVAKKHRLTATINGKDEAWWRKNIEDLFEEDPSG